MVRGVNTPPKINVTPYSDSAPHVSKIILYSRTSHSAPRVSKIILYSRTPHSAPRVSKIVLFSRTPHSAPRVSKIILFSRTPHSAPRVSKIILYSRTPQSSPTLRGDKVSTCILTYTHPHKPMRKIKVTICNHQTDIPLDVWPDV